MFQMIEVGPVWCVVKGTGMCGANVSGGTRVAK